MDIPNLKEIYNKVQDEVSSPVEGLGETSSVKKTIRERIEDYVEEKKQLNLSSNFEKVTKFIVQFLNRAVNEKYYKKFLDYLSENYSDLKSLQKEKLSTLGDYLLSIGYRFWNEGPKVIINSLNLFEEKYDFNFEDYIKGARKIDNINKNYPKDPFLSIKNVAFKVRDLGLSMFLNDYIAIDTHIMRLSIRTGILLNTYAIGLPLTTDVTREKPYLNVRKVLFETAKKNKISLGELDRTFWHFGRTICGAKKPKCDECPIADICCSHRYKIFNNFRIS